MKRVDEMKSGGYNFCSEKSSRRCSNSRRNMFNSNSETFGVN